MVIVVSAGAKPTSGYSVEITGLDIQNDVLTVHWRSIRRSPAIS